MLTKPSQIETSLSGIAGALWLWTALVSIATGIAFGNIFATEHAYSDAEFSGGAFVAGLVAGAVSTVPLWALYNLGAKIQANLVAFRSQLADVEAARSKQSNAGVVAAGNPSTNGIGSQAMVLAVDSESQAPSTELTLAGLEPGEVATRLLADPALAADIHRMRREAGDKTAARALFLRAKEQGYDGQHLREWHLPSE